METKTRAKRAAFPEGRNPLSDPGVRECVKGFSTWHTLTVLLVPLVCGCGCVR